MTKPEKKRFCYGTKEDLTLESTGDDVIALQTMLATFFLGLCRDMLVEIGANAVQCRRKFRNSSTHRLSM